MSVCVHLSGVASELGVCAHLSGVVSELGVCVCAHLSGVVSEMGLGLHHPGDGILQLGTSVCALL